MMGLSSLAHAQLPGSGNANDFNLNNAQVVNNAALNPGATMTIEAWIKADSWAPNVWQNVIVSKDGWATGEEGYTLRCGANGTLSFNFGTIGSWHEVTSGPAMIIGEWYHVAGTYDGQYLRCYINGQVMDSTAYVGTIAPSTYNLTIGQISYTSGGTRDFDGNIDEVRIWSSANSQTELRDWMCKKVTNSHPQYGSLMAYYNMDETTGSTMVDQGPNGLDGTYNGPTRVTSGAAIGDASDYYYGTPSALVLDYMNTDSVRVNQGGSAPLMHLYRVDGPSNDPTPPTGYDQIDQTHYYGVFAPPTGALAYQVQYMYGSNPLVAGTNEARADLVERVDNSSTPWNAANASLDQTNDSLTKSYVQRQEFILALESCPIAVLDFTGPQVICGSSTLTVTEQTGGWLGHQWFINGNPIGGANNNNYTITGPGDYQILVTDGTCIDTSDVVMVTVGTTPTVTFGLINATHCENDGSAAILGGAPSGGTYSGAGIIGTSFDPPTAGVGTHTVYYTVNDTSGCTGIDSTSVTVLAAPSVSVSNWPDVCLNDPALTLSGGSPVGGVYSGNGVNGGSFDPAAAGVGTHTITYTYADGNGCTAQATATIAVNAVPNTPTITQNGADLCITPGGLNVQWVDGNGADISGANDSCLTTTADGMYGVIITDGNGCASDTAWFDMNYFGIGEASWGAGMTLAPNPVRDVLTISFNQEMQNTQVRILDAQGRVLGSQMMNGQQVNISMAGFARGMYFMEVSNQNGRVLRSVVRQ